MSDRQFNALAQAYDVHNTGKIDYHCFTRAVAETVLPANSGNLKVKSLSRLESSADQVAAAAVGADQEPTAATTYNFTPEATKRRRRPAQLAEQPTLAKWVETRFARRAVADTTALARAFRRLDTGSTGYLSLTDFKSALRKVGVAITDTEARLLASSVTNDGNSGRSASGGEPRVSLRSFSDVVARHFVAKAQNVSMVDMDAEYTLVQKAREKPRESCVGVLVLHVAVRDACCC